MIARGASAWAMGSRRALLGGAVFAAAGLLAAPAQAVNACGDQVHEDQCGKGNIYPCCDNGGNCTWWAWEAVCRNWHMGLVNWGNANTWAGHAAVDPAFDVISTPVVGSIATRDLGQFGHVAWVIAVNGNSVTVTEENCCDGCAPGLRTHTYQAGYFNSGYVVRHGSTCQCTPGSTETEACGNCGTRTRTCDPGCGWGGWGACGGPDPGGGNVACATGAVGACAEGRERCVDGNVVCRSLVDPSPEVCDGVDNDCNGAVDEGHPPVGAAPPEWAAALVDVSYPQTLRAGERAMAWAEFRNVGTRAWDRGEVWLAARGGKDGGASAFFMPEAWPAWDVAAALSQPVPPGETGRFAFEITAPPELGEISETFQLRVAAGAWIGCPEPEIAPAIRVVHAVASGSGGAGGAGGAPAAGPESGSRGGCSTAPSGGGVPWGAAFAVAAMVAWRAGRRAGRAGRR